MYKNRRHPTEVECRLFCPILSDRCRFRTFLKLLSYRHTPKGGFFHCFVFSFFSREKGVPRLRARVTLLLFASGGLFSFSSERKEEKKRRQKLRFWISLRGFICRLSCLFSPRGRCAVQTSPKCCTVYAPLSAAAFALKCRRTSFCRGRNQRQRRRRRDDPFIRTTK